MTRSQCQSDLQLPRYSPAQDIIRLAVGRASHSWESSYSTANISEDLLARPRYQVTLPCLASYVDANDPLPSDWNIFKRKKLSEADKDDLMQRLELHHGLRQTEPRRLSDLDRSAFIDSDLQRKGCKRSESTRLAQSGYNLHLTAFFHKITDWNWVQVYTPKTLVTQTALRQEGVVQRISSFTNDLCALTYEMLLSALSFLHNCTTLTGQAYKKIWWILKWPLAITAAFLFALNSVAFAYALNHEAFLSSFCMKELPVVRNWMCSEWDRRQRSANGYVEGNGNFTDPLERLLLLEGSINSYQLPHILGRYQTTVRSFRVNLPNSHFSSIDQSYLREQFTNYIDLSSRATRSSQEFASHVIGPISRASSDTQYLVDKLSKYNFTSPAHITRNIGITLDNDATLSKSMAWFNSHYLVYLPAGIVPFRQRIVQIPYVEGIFSLQRHIGYIANRLAVDIEMALTLQGQLKDLSAIGEKIEDRVASSRPDNDIKLASRSNWRYLTEQLLWKSFESYQVGQRAEWLEAMAIAFKETRTFLDGAVIDLGAAQASCNSLNERLLEEAGAVADGWSIAGGAIREMK